MGTLKTCLWGLALSAPTTLAVPLASLPGPGSYAVGQAIFYLSLAARQAASMNAFTSSSASPRTLFLPLSFGQAIFCLSLAARQAASMNAFTSSNVFLFYTTNFH